MKLLCSHYWTCQMRAKVNKLISGCGVCALNNASKSAAEKTGFVLSSEPNLCVTIDCAGPLRGWASTSSGKPRYLFISIDNFSRYVFARVMSDVKDASILRSIRELRHALSGLPMKVQCDNALLTKNSNSRRFLEEQGVEIRHGKPFISRDQTLCERVIRTLTDIYKKLHTDAPETPFEQLVNEAVLVYNGSPSDALPESLSPKEVHFCRAPSNFLRHEFKFPGKVGKTVKEFFEGSRAAGRATLKHAVHNYIRRKPLESPMKAPRIKAGDICLKKRTTFASDSPKKLQYRRVVDAFEVERRVATNSFRCKSVVDGVSRIFAGDHLIKLAGFNRQRALALVESMELARDKGASTRSKRKHRSGHVSAIRLFHPAPEKPSTISDDVSLAESFIFKR